MGSNYQKEKQRIFFPSNTTAQNRTALGVWSARKSCSCLGIEEMTQSPDQAVISQGLRRQFLDILRGWPSNTHNQIQRDISQREEEDNH